MIVTDRRHRASAVSKKSVDMAKILVVETTPICSL
jgi:hypothetical protein